MIRRLWCLPPPSVAVIPCKGVSMMRWIDEERDERIAGLYGKPTPTQLACAASRIEASCRAFVECADAALRSGEMNIPNALRLEAAYKALDHAAAEIRVWLTETGYINHIDAEQDIQKMGEMIDNVDKKIAEFRDDPTFQRWVVAVEQVRYLSRAFYDCAGAAYRRHEQIYSSDRFERAYFALFESAEDLWIRVQKCHRHP